jgi:hypothetical protein
MTELEKNKIRKKIASKLQVENWSSENQIVLLKDAIKLFAELDKHEICGLIKDCIQIKKSIAEGQIKDMEEINKNDMMFTILVNEYFCEFIDVVLAEEEKILHI